MTISIPGQQVSIQLKSGEINPVWYEKLVALINAVNAGEAISGSTTGEWTFSTAITPPLASGDIQFNNATQSAATNFYIHQKSNNGNDATHLLKLLLVSGTRVLVQDSGNSANYVAFQLTANATYTSPYYAMPITVTDYGNPIANNKNCLVVIAG